jgi:ABC-type transporter Mla MlaB component
MTGKMDKHLANQSLSADTDKPAESQEVEVILSDEWNEFSHKFSQAENWQDSELLPKDKETPVTEADTDDFFNDFDPLESIQTVTASSGAESLTPQQLDNEKPPAKSSGVIALSPRQTLENIQSLYQLLKENLEKEQSIEIDASAVMQIDTATLQLLVVARHTLAKSDKTVMINFPSESFIEAAQLLDMEEVLGLDQLTAGLF